MKELWLPGFDAYVGAHKRWSYHKGTKLQTGYGWCQWRRRYRNDLCNSWALLVGLRVWDKWLEPEGKNLCKIFSSSKGLPRCTWRKLWWGLDLMHRVWGPLFKRVFKGIWILKESPRASRFLCLNGSVAGRFCRSKNLVSLLQSLESSN